MNLAFKNNLIQVRDYIKVESSSKSLPDMFFLNDVLDIDTNN